MSLGTANRKPSLHYIFQKTRAVARMRAQAQTGRRRLFETTNRFGDLRNCGRRD